MSRKKQVTEKMWYRVEVPKAWRPQVGEELVGTYLSSEVKQGQYGEYAVHYVELRAGKIVYITGSRATALFAVIQRGARVKVVFNGEKQCVNSELSYKDYDVFTEKEVKLSLKQAM